MGFIDAVISKIPDINDYIDESIPVIEANKYSHKGLIVPEIIKNYSQNKGIINDNIYIMPNIIKTLIEMRKSYSRLRLNPYLNNNFIAENTLDEFSLLAHKLGVNDIGYTKVNPSMIFKDKKILFSNAIVLTMQMKREAIDLAPSITTKQEVFRTYLELGKIVNKLTSFLISKGFNAQAGPALGGDVNYPRLAESAGLGQIGKHGILISPKFGPSLRIAAIYTDIENLPIATNNTHKWIQSFCKSCNRCVKACPSSAIYTESIVFEDGSKECIDFKKCAIPFTNQHGCSLCIKECSFYRNNYYELKEKYDGSI